VRTPILPDEHGVTQIFVSGVASSNSIISPMVLKAPEFGYGRYGQSGSGFAAIPSAHYHNCRIKPSKTLFGQAYQGIGSLTGQFSARAG
jgi:hypothetical protein